MQANPVFQNKLPLGAACVPEAKLASAARLMRVFFRKSDCVLQPDPNDEMTLIRPAGTFPQGKVKEAGKRLRAAGYAGKSCVPE